MISPILVSAFLLLLSEVADKTMLLILGLALQYKSRLQVFLGALSAHALMDLVAILVGTSVAVPEPVLRVVVGSVFIALGLWQLYKLFLRRAHHAKRKMPKASTAFFASFLFVSLSEFGDKSQILSGILGAKYGLLAFVGILIGLAFAIGLNVFVAASFAERLPRKGIKIAVALLFILFGIASFFFS